MPGRHIEGFIWWVFFSVKHLPCFFCEGVNRFSMILKSTSLGLVCIYREIWNLSHTLLENALWMLHIYSFHLLFLSALVLSLLGLGIWLQIHSPPKHQILFRTYSGHSSWVWSNLSFLWGLLTDFYGKPKGQMACSMPEWSD